MIKYNYPALTIVCSSLLGALSASAQTSGGMTLEEVVVTAQKREETLQNAALSVASLDGDEVRKAGKSDLVDMLRGVAGLETGNGSFFMRGVGNQPAFGQDGSVTVSMNGVFMQTQQSRRDVFYDIARVEVARGPQSTLTGRTSEGGAINIITNEPRLEQLEAKGLVEVANYDTLATEGVLNLPLGSRVALRTAAATVSREGYFSSGGDISSHSGRMRLLIEPTDDMKLIVSGDYSRSSLSGSGTGNIGTAPGQSGVIDLTQPFRPLNGPYWNPTPPLSKATLTIKNAYADFTWKTPFTTIFFQPTYQESSNFAYPTYTTNPSNLASNLALGYNYAAAVARSTTATSGDTAGDSRSYELRFSSPENSTFTWLMGLWYYRAFQELGQQSSAGSGTSSPNNATANPANATAVGFLPTVGYPSIYPQSTNRKSVDKDVYFQATYPILPTWRVTGGARYSEATKERGTSIGAFLAPDGTVLNANSRFPLDNNVTGSTSLNGPFVYYDISGSSITQDRVNGLVKLEHDFADRSMGYAMVSTGWKSGAFVSVPSSDFICSTTPRAGAAQAGGCASAVPVLTPGYRSDYDPEYLTAYEIGSKNTLLDDRLRLNGSIFYYDYRNYQFSYNVNWINPATGVDPDFQPQTSLIGNADEAESHGGEIEASFLITPQDRIDLNVAYTNARLKRIDVPDLAPTNVQTWAASLEGFKFPHAPEWQISPRYSRTFDFADGSQVAASIDAQYSSKQYTRLPSNCAQVVGSYAAGTCTAAALTVGDYVETYYTQPSYTKVNLSLNYRSPSEKWSVTAYVKNLTDKVTYNTLTPPNAFVGTGNVSFIPDDPRMYGIIFSGSLSGGRQ